jgi:hypothetical protein
VTLQRSVRGRFGRKHAVLWRAVGSYAVTRIAAWRRAYTAHRAYCILRARAR